MASVLSTREDRGNGMHETASEPERLGKMEGWGWGEVDLRDKLGLRKTLYANIFTIAARVSCSVRLITLSSLSSSNCERS